MNIAFICGSVEAGRDGVGDYVRRLAEACRSSGHTITIISINDTWIKNPQLIEGPIAILRLPKALYNKDQENKLKAHLLKFKPDYISLQFVCYSFHPKGLCWRVSNFLKRIKGNTPCHIMAHELWIGPHQGAPIKEKIIGWLQKILIKPIFKQAHHIHTHTPTYQYLLKKEGIASTLLPLFSNIPIAAQEKESYLIPLLKKQGINISNDTRNDFLIFGFFGSIYRNFSPRLFLETITQVTQKTGKKIIVLSIGHLGASKIAWDAFSRNNLNAIIFSKVTPVTEKTLSLCLQELDYGVATTPLSLIEKSGSAAVLKAHGLPTLICRDDVHFSEFTPNNIRTDFHILTPKSIETLPSLKKITPLDNLSHIAQIFLKSISQ